jgi:hypothetical protein
MSVDPLHPPTNGSPTTNGEHAPSSTDIPPPSGRDAHGRFTKGNPGSAGNPFARNRSREGGSRCSPCAQGVKVKG